MRTRSHAHGAKESAGEQQGCHMGATWPREVRVGESILVENGRDLGRGYDLSLDSRKSVLLRSLEQVLIEECPKRLPRVDFGFDDANLAVGRVEAEEGERDESFEELVHLQPTVASLGLLTLFDAAVGG